MQVVVPSASFYCNNQAAISAIRMQQIKRTNPTKASCLSIDAAGCWLPLPLPLPLPVASCVSRLLSSSLSLQSLCLLEPLFISVVSFWFWVSFFPKDAEKKTVTATGIHMYYYYYSCMNFFISVITLVLCMCHVSCSSSLILICNKNAEFNGLP